MEKGKVAVLLIDMQPHFIIELPEGEKERIVSSQIEVIRRCGRERIPIFVIEYADEGDTIRELRREIRRARKATEIYRMKKTTDSAFSNGNLAALLRGLGIERLYLMGINAGACVKETAESAIACGFSIITSPEVISAASHHAGDHSIPWYRKNGSLVTPDIAF